MNENQQENEINIKEEIFKYLSHWRWFLISIFIAILVAFAYLKNAKKIYETNAKILVKEDNSGDYTGQLLSGLSETGLFSAKNKLENEIEILKSRTLNAIVIDSLKANTTVIGKDGFLDKFLYKETKPFEGEFIPKKGEKSQITFSLKLQNPNTFEIETKDETISNLKFGQKIHTQKGTIILQKRDIQAAKTDNFVVSIDNSVNASEEYIRSLFVNPVSKESNVIELSMRHPNPEFAADYINALIHFYNQQAIFDKRFVSESTSEFISNRLNIIAEELGDVEKTVENYKSSNNIADIQSEVTNFIENLSVFEKEYIENETKISITKDIIAHISRSKIDDLVPSGIVMSDASAESYIGEINSLILEKQKLSVSSTPENPNYKALEEQIKRLKSNLLQSLKSQLNSLTIARNDLKRKENELQSRLNQVPKQEREFRIIDRQQRVKEGLYLFLLQKREETNIALAATEKNAKVIDIALPNDKQVAPKKMIILLGALVLGVLIPFIILYIRYLLDDKVKTRMDIEKVSDIPYLGDVPTSQSSDQLMDFESRSSAAEAIRIVRTNLEFILSGVRKEKSEAKTIFVTSTFPGEGKTFICANLAATIALSGKKVLLVGMDLRNPKINEYINIPNRGFTNYLFDKNNPIQDYIIKVPNYPQFDVLPSGTIPPNPVEMLIDEATQQVFDSLKQQYDYILVDTAPVAPVTDTLLINKYADMFVYVVRANKLEKKMLDIPIKLHKENKLNRMAFLLNDADVTKGYGYGYGYGKDNEDEKKPLWKRILGIK